MEHGFFNLDLLDYHNTKNRFTDREYAQAMAEELSDILEAYKVKGKITDIKMTPYAVLFDFMPEPGTSVKKIQNLRTDLEVHMASPIEIIGIGEKQHIIGVAIKNWIRPIIGLRDIMESSEFRSNQYMLPVAGGMDVLGKPFLFDLAETPHLLVAGTTGSGKSVFLNDIIISLLYTKSPDEVNIVMVDTKYVELSSYNGIPHLLFPVVTDAKRAVEVLHWVDAEITRRYDKFVSTGVKNINSYNTRVSKESSLPRIVIVIDEYMEMMFEAPKELEKLIKKISLLARAAGIHLVIATQRPSSDVITNEIKASLPCRASFTVVDWRESKTILDRTGAERLLGNGDMLFSAAEAAIPTHAQAAYISDEELDRVIARIKLL